MPPYMYLHHLPEEDVSGSGGRSWLSPALHSPTWKGRFIEKPILESIWHWLSKQQCKKVQMLLLFELKLPQPHSPLTQSCMDGLACDYTQQGTCYGIHLGYAAWDKITCTISGPLQWDVCSLGTAKLKVCINRATVHISCQCISSGLFINVTWKIIGQILSWHMLMELH